MLHLMLQAIKVMAVAVLAVATIGAARSALTHLSAAAVTPSRMVAVVVSPNETSTQVAQDLRDKGLIHSATVFRLELRLSNPGGGLVTGTHVLHSGMTVAQIVTALTQTTAATPTGG